MQDQVVLCSFPKNDLWNPSQAQAGYNVHLAVMDFLALKTGKVVNVAGCRTIYNFLKIYKEVFSLDTLPTPTLPYNFAAALSAINHEGGRDNSIPASTPATNNGTQATTGGDTAPPEAATTPPQAGTAAPPTPTTRGGGPFPVLPPAPMTPGATPSPEAQPWPPPPPSPMLPSF